MLSLAQDKRERLYLYLLLLSTLLFQLRYIPPAWGFEVQSSHIKTVFFVVAVLLTRDGMSSLCRYDKKLLGLCFLFFLFALLSSMNSVDRVTAVGRWYCYFANLLLAFGLMLGLRAGKVSASGILYTTLIACSIIVLAEARDVFQEWEMYRSMNRKFLWTPLYFNQIRNFAHVPFVGLLFSVFLVSLSPGWRRKLGAMLSLLFMLALLWTGGRAPLLVLPICLLLFFFLLPKGDGKRIFLVWLASAIFGYGLLHATSNDFMLQQSLARFGRDGILVLNMIVPQFVHETSLLQELGSVGGELGSGRAVLWQHALGLWWRQPMLGSGGDAFFIDNGYSFLHPHNWLLRMLLEFGILGASLATLLLLRLLSGGLLLIRANSPASLIYTVAYVQLVAWLIYGALSGNLYFNWSLAIFAIASAIVGEAVGHRRSIAEGEPGRVPVAGSEDLAQVSSARGG